MEAGMKEIAAVKMVVKRWEKIREEIPKICLVAQVSDPFTVSLAACAAIMRAECIVAKKAGTVFAIEKFAAEVAEEMKETDEVDISEMLAAMMGAADGED